MLLLSGVLRAEDIRVKDTQGSGKEQGDSLHLDVRHRTLGSVHCTPSAIHVLSKNMQPDPRRLVCCLGLMISLMLLTAAVSAQVIQNFTITASDGVSLEATLALPDSGAPASGFPTVVLIHGYGGDKDGMSFVSTYLTTLAYGCLTYSVRGQGNSGGLSTTMGPRETQDLLEVIQHLRTMPGVDPERLAVAGGSQGGIHAWIAATHAMPGVKVIASLVGPPSFSLDLFPHNCIKQQLHFELNLGAVRYDPLRDRLREFVVKDQYDSALAFAASRDLEYLLDSVRIPVVHSTGWGDVLFPVNGAIRAVNRLTQRGIPVWSYFGTNGHGEPVHLGEYFYELGLMTSWFDRWLKGVPLDRSDVPFIVYADDRPGWPHHEVVGWPPEPQGTVRLYLAGTRLQTTYPSQAIERPFTQSYDSTYTPAEGWADAYSGTAFTNAFHASPARFLSDPLADTLEVTGIPHTVLRLHSDASRFQSHLRIFDVVQTDTGSVWSLITRGANGVRKNIPGTSLESGFDCQALSHLLPAGHRIGVEVTALDMYDDYRAQIIPYFNSATSGVSSSAAEPSYVDLPLVGAARFVAVAPPPVAQPSAMILHQNYPNPFNPTTTIRFSLATSQQVHLEVVTILGQQVAVLLDGVVEQGQHAVQFNGNGLATGMYICRMMTRSSTLERKMLLIR